MLMVRPITCVESMALFPTISEPLELVNIQEIIHWIGQKTRDYWLALYLLVSDRPSSCFCR